MRKTETRTFVYTVKDLKGEARRGSVRAASAAEAARAIAGEGVFVTRLEEERAPSCFARLSRRGVPRERLALSCRQLAIMASAGLPLMEALDTLCAQVRDARLRAAWEAVRQAVGAGESLAVALESQRAVFPCSVAALVAAGEAGGVLAETLERVAAQLERNARLRTKLQMALFYPLFVLTLAVFVVFIVLVGVLPVFAAVYESAGRPLPTATRWLLGLSAFCEAYGALLGAGFAAAFLAAARLLRGGVWRARADHWLLRLPVCGGLLGEIAVARFCRTLGVLLQSGVSLLAAFAVAKQTLGNAYLTARMADVEAGLKRGEAFAPLLERVPFLAPMTARMVAVGEAAGKLDFVLVKIAAYYEQEAEKTASLLGRLLEPVLTLVAGAVVAFVIFAVALPMFDAALYSAGQ